MKAPGQFDPAHGGKLGIASASGAPYLPEDLSLYLGKKTIVMLILEAVQTINGERLEFNRFASANGETFHSPMLLTLLTYCYATGVYGSADIEVNVGRDPMTRYLCARTYPDMGIIRGFRRQNREKLSQCLTLVLKRAWELRFSGEENESDKYSFYLTASISRWMESGACPDFAREAEERIAKAIRSDSMSLDE
jgi:transposase